MEGGLRQPCGDSSPQSPGCLENPFHIDPFLAVPGYGRQAYIDMVSFRSLVETSTHTVIVLQVADDRLNDGSEPLKPFKPVGV